MWPTLGKNGNRRDQSGVDKVSLRDGNVAIELAGLGTTTLNACIGKSEGRSETMARHVHLQTPMRDPGPAVKTAKSMIETIQGKSESQPP
jgi:hypothetical protein